MNQPLPTITMKDVVQVSKIREQKDSLEVVMAIYC